MSRGSCETLISGLLLLILAAVGLLASAYPRIGSPFPMLTITPAFLFSWQHLQVAAIFVPSLLFFAWNPGLLRGEVSVPHQSQREQILQVQHDPPRSIIHTPPLISFCRAFCHLPHP